MTDPDLVLYHGSCYDGFSAAWTAHLRFPEAEYLGVTYGQPPPDVAGRHVLMLDFCYPFDQLVGLWLAAKSLYVIDHHKTALPILGATDVPHLFDLEHSGCVLTWRYLFPSVKIPEWMQRVEDRDLWRHAIPDTPQVHAYVASLPMTFESWDQLDRTPLERVLVFGAHIRRYMETVTQKHAAEAFLVTDPHGRPVVVLNVPYLNSSETASYLLGQWPDAAYAMCYFRRADGQWQYSLRSKAPFDVSEVAKEYGGGGHAQAAGFETETLLEWV